MVAGAALLVGLVGCASPNAALGSSTATVTLNGTNLGSQPVTCSQVGWNWTIKSVNEKGGFTAVLSTHETVTARSVQIEDMGGFTGSFWEGTVGDGRASVANSNYRISGTAEGWFNDAPTDRVDATFEIETDC